MEKIIWYLKTGIKLPMLAEDIGPIEIHFIKKTICNYFNLGINDINGKSRKRKLVIARQLMHYFARKNTTHSLKEIGFHCGNRDHATVMYSYKTILNDIIYDDEVRYHHNQLIDLL